jgi:ABC-type glycerol-3-phosphate transport system permease component
MKRLATTNERPRLDLALLYRFLALVLVAGIVVLPLAATALGGFKTLGDLRQNTFGLPEIWVVENYLQILRGERLWRMLGNSLIIGGLTVFLTLVTASMVAFLFAHLRFFGSNMLLGYFLLGPALPGGDCGAAALHQDPGSRAPRYLLGRDPAADRLQSGPRHPALAPRL